MGTRNTTNKKYKVIHAMSQKDKKEIFEREKEGMVGRKGGRERMKQSTTDISKRVQTNTFRHRRCCYSYSYYYYKILKIVVVL